LSTPVLIFGRFKMREFHMHVGDGAVNPQALTLWCRSHAWDESFPLYVYDTLELAGRCYHAIPQRDSGNAATGHLLLPQPCVGRVNQPHSPSRSLRHPTFSFWTTYHMLCPRKRTPTRIPIVHVPNAGSPRRSDRHTIDKRAVSCRILHRRSGTHKFG
jgi:hypothetical protein